MALLSELGMSFRTPTPVCDKIYVTVKHDGFSDSGIIGPINTCASDHNSSNRENNCSDTMYGLVMSPCDDLVAQLPKSRNTPTTMIMSFKVKGAVFTQASLADEPVICFVSVRVTKSYVTLGDAECIFTADKVGYVTTKALHCNQPSNRLIADISSLLSGGCRIVRPQQSFTFIGAIANDPTMSDVETARIRIELEGRLFLAQHNNESSPFGSSGTVSNMNTLYDVNVVVDVIMGGSICVCQSVERQSLENVSQPTIYYELRNKADEMIQKYQTNPLHIEDT